MGKKPVENHKYEYGCLMLQLENNIINWDDVQSIISDEDIFEGEGYGRETEPHTTVLFGFHEEIGTEDVKKIVAQECSGPLTISTSQISIFECPEFDVVKFDIDSDDLVKLNKLCKELPHTCTYPDYHAHMTIAYVKKGTGQKYVRKINTTEMTSRTFKYSFAAGKNESWKIK